MPNLFQRYYETRSDVPELFRADYYFSLDGFRGVSIFIVILGHLNFRWGNVTLANLLQDGHLGVYIFFVISGFLITTLILKEKSTNGTVSLRRFYMRRFLRIFPVAVLYLSVICLLNYFFSLDVSLVAVLAAALYLRNFSFMGEGSWYVNHYWSLSVEEQFYLIFPFFLKWNLRVYKILIPLTILTIVGVRLVYSQGGVTGDGMVFLLDFLDKGLEGILIGSLFSILVFQGMISFAVLRRFRLALNIILPILILAVCNNNLNNYLIHVIPSFLSNTFLYILISLFILNNITYSKDLFFKFLNCKVMVLIGILSYSIYIWQQLFTVSEAYVPGSSSLPWYGFPLNVVLLAIVSFLSYKYYEKPVRNLRKRFELGPAISAA